jgi:hypothetical protein
LNWGGALLTGAYFKESVPLRQADVLSSSESRPHDTQSRPADKIFIYLFIGGSETTMSTTTTTTTTIPGSAGIDRARVQHALAILSQIDPTTPGPRTSTGSPFANSPIFYSILVHRKTDIHFCCHFFSFFFFG